MNQEFKSIIDRIKHTEKITQGEIAERLGVSRSYISEVINGRAPFNDTLRENMNTTFPNIVTSEPSVVEREVMGFMRAHTYTVDDMARILGVPSKKVIDAIADGFDEESAKMWSDAFGFSMRFLLTGEGDVMKSGFTVVPLLPVSAHAGQLQDFAVSVSDYECERIVAPVMDAEMAVPIIGESMYPELPSGAIVFIKKVNGSFIEWGKPYVLDTTNGVIVKYLAPGGEGKVRCISANPNPMYAPFDIPMGEIYGVYRIVSLLCNK